MLCRLKCTPVKGLDFSFVAEPSQQQFAVPIFHRNIQGVRTCPPTKKPTNRDYGKLIQWWISPIFPTDFWPDCFVRGKSLLLTRKILKNCPRLSPQECMQSPKSHHGPRSATWSPHAPARADACLRQLYRSHTIRNSLCLWRCHIWSLPSWI